MPIQDLCYQPALDEFVVYQYLIGNTDRWISNLHNIKLVTKTGVRPVPVPYDFDYSGAINTPYSVPHKSLSIKSVLKYYDDFYKVIHNPDAAENLFYDKCPLTHKHLNR